MYIFIFFLFTFLLPFSVIAQVCDSKVPTQLVENNFKKLPYELIHQILFYSLFGEEKDFRSFKKADEQLKKNIDLRLVCKLFNEATSKSFGIFSANPFYSKNFSLSDECYFNKNAISNLRINKFLSGLNNETRDCYKARFARAKQQIIFYLVRQIDLESLFVKEDYNYGEPSLAELQLIAQAQSYREKKDDYPEYDSRLIKIRFPSKDGYFLEKTKIAPFFIEKNIEDVQKRINKILSDKEQFYQSGEEDFYAEHLPFQSKTLKEPLSLLDYAVLTDYSGKSLKALKDLGYRSSRYTDTLACQIGNGEALALLLDYRMEAIGNKILEMIENKTILLDKDFLECLDRRRLISVKYYCKIVDSALSEKLGYETSKYIFGKLDINKISLEMRSLFFGEMLKKKNWSSMRAAIDVNMLPTTNVFLCKNLNEMLENLYIKSSFNTRKKIEDGVCTGDIQLYPCNMQNFDELCSAWERVVIGVPVCFLFKNALSKKHTCSMPNNCSEILLTNQSVRESIKQCDDRGNKEWKDLAEVIRDEENRFRLRFDDLPKLISDDTQSARCNMQ